MSSGLPVGTAACLRSYLICSQFHPHGLGIGLAFISLHAALQISQHWDNFHKRTRAVQCAQVFERQEATTKLLRPWHWTCGSRGHAQPPPQRKEATMATLSEFYTRGCELCGAEVEVWIFSGTLEQPVQFLRCKQIACVLNTSRSEMAKPIGMDQRRRAPGAATESAKCKKRACSLLLNRGIRQRRHS